MFNFQNIASWTFRAQIQLSPVGYTDTDLPTTNIYGIGRIAFGSYTSPDFRGQNLFIADTPTLSPVALPTKPNTIDFNLFLPTSPQPAGGYPVVVVCHGGGDTRFGEPTAMAPQLNPLGFAVIVFPFFQVDPYFYLAYLTTDQETSVAIAADNMIGGFFASGGTMIRDVNDLMRVVFGANIWETPAVLTETLNF